MLVHQNLNPTMGTDVFVLVFLLICNSLSFERLFLYVVTIPW